MNFSPTSGRPAHRTSVLGGLLRLDAWYADGSNGKPPGWVITLHGTGRSSRCLGGGYASANHAMVKAPEALARFLAKCVCRQNFDPPPREELPDDEDNATSGAPSAQ